MDTEILQAIDRLSLANQRLIRELIWKLAQLEQLATPEDHDSRLDYQSQLDPWAKSLIAQGKSSSILKHYVPYVRKFLSSFPSPSLIYIESQLASTSDPFWIHRASLCFYVFANCDAR